MKKFWKWALCFAMTTAVTGATLLPAMTAKAAEETYDTACDVAEYVYQGYYHCATGVNPDSNGPIAIAPATLVDKDANGNEVRTEVYVVGLAGTEFMFNEPRGIMTDLQVGFEQDNFYIREIRDTVCEVVPSGANIILTGHSLGGMVAQQASGDETLKSRYNILNTVTFGSPLINPIGREGQVKRLGDTADIVPYLSVNSVLLPAWQVTGLNTEDGGYATSEFADAHMKSYTREDVWGEYDVLGVKGGTAKLIIDGDQIESYGAYVIPWLDDLPKIDMSFWS